MVSCFNTQGELEGYVVPEEVYVYIKQLEGYVAEPHKSCLLDAYSFRFSDGLNNLKDTN
jgi:hypothetical protein